MTKPKRNLAIVTLIICTIMYLIFSPLLSNLWGLLIDTQGVYVIPESSSIFTFHPTLMNTGSGDWWIYAEDHRAYYYFENRSISKPATQHCPGFLKHDYSTWCLE
jgi:hypothetical protein